jgi:hypothetical protein
VATLTKLSPGATANNAGTPRRRAAASESSPSHPRPPDRSTTAATGGRIEAATCRATTPPAEIAGMPVAANLEGQERLVSVLKHPHSVDLPTVAYLHAQAFDLMKQYEAVASPTSLLSQAAERLEQITLLREHAPWPRPAGAVPG